MVIFGGLELVAAGYLLHKHAKNSKEARRLEEEEERLRIEEEELRRERRRERHRRNRSHSPRRDGKHSYDYEPRHNTYEDRKSARQSRPEYLAPPAMQPPRASSAPPQQQQQQPVRDGYPPTGWPADWEQSRRPEPNTNLDRNTNTDLNANGYPQDVKYGWRDDQPHGESSTHHSSLRTDDGERRSRGRSDPRQAAAPHVRFAPLPRDDDDDDRAPRSPPPAYNG